MCSACDGDYENPDMTSPSEEERDANCGVAGASAKREPNATAPQVLYQSASELDLILAAAWGVVCSNAKLNKYRSDIV